MRVTLIPKIASLMHLQWLGLRPSQLDDLDLPPQAYAPQTSMDEKK